MSSIRFFALALAVCLLAVCVSCVSLTHQSSGQHVRQRIEALKTRRNVSNNTLSVLQQVSAKTRVSSPPEPGFEIYADGDGKRVDKVQLTVSEEAHVVGAGERIGIGELQHYCAGPDTICYWPFYSSELPAGLSMDSQTGSITGAPQTAGTTVVSVWASGSYVAVDAETGEKYIVGVEVTQDITITVAEAAVNGGGEQTDNGGQSGPGFEIYVGDDGQRLDAVTLTMGEQAHVVGAGERIGIGELQHYCAGPNTLCYWPFYSSELPAGLSMDSQTGSITGTPQTAGTTVVSVSASGSYVAVDAETGEKYAVGVQVDQDLTITVVAPKPAPGAPANVVYSPSTVSFTVDRSITHMKPTYDAGTSAVKFSISPKLPTGMWIASTTGTIGGKPTKVTPATEYTVTATNKSGSATAKITITTTAKAAAGGDSDHHSSSSYSHHSSWSHSSSSSHAHSKWSK